MRELIVEDTYLDIDPSFSCPVTKTIADVREPDKRDGDYTKTLRLPGTPINDKFFQFHYQANVKTSSFNPNTKKEAKYLEYNVTVISGVLRLISIEHKEVNGVQEVYYDCAVIGNVSTLFNSIGDKLLVGNPDSSDDLDFSEYDHTYNRTNQKNSWATSIIKNGGAQAFAYGSGYVYDHIDRGRNGFQFTKYHVQHFAPSIYEIEYVNKIFALAGKTFSSSFLGGALHNHIVIPNNEPFLTLSASQVLQYTFWAGRPGLGTVKTTNLSFGSSRWFTAGGSFDTTTNQLDHICSDESTSPFNDAGAVHNSGTGVFSVPVTNWYQLKGVVAFNIKANFPATATTCQSVATKVCIRILKSTDGGSTWNTDAGTQINIPLGIDLTTSYQSVAFNINHPVSLYTGTNQLKVDVRVAASDDFTGITFKDGGGAFVTTGSASLDIRGNTSSTFGVNLMKNDLVEGQTVEMNNTVPKNYKQKDLLMSIIRSHNLYVDIDKEDPNNYIIEPRDDYYTGEIEDWSDKWVWEEPTITKPMGELNWKVARFRYKEDSDYFNKLYQDSFKEPYGSEEITVENDYLKDVLTTELIFSATPIRDNPNNDIICPQICEYDGNQVKPVKHNIRRLYYSGVRNLNSTWTYETAAGNFTENTYAFSGMVDDPLNPTISLEWDNPLKLFYNYPYFTYTDNCLYNAHYSRHFNEITDPDSKLVTKWMKLNEVDMGKFSFRKTVFIKDAVFLCNKILDYDQQKESLTQVELLKIKQYGAFVASEVAFNPDLGTGVGASVSMSYQTNGSNNFQAGVNNVSLSEGSVMSGTSNFISGGCEKCNILGGEDNFIGPDCENVSLIDCINVKVSEGVTNFTGKGLQDEIITTDFSDTSIIIDEGSLDTYTTDFSTSLDKKKYLVDATNPPGSPPGTTVTATLIDGYINQEFFFIKTDNSANTVTIGPATPGATINGVGTYVLTNQYDKVTLVFDGSNYFIL